MADIQEVIIKLSAETSGNAAIEAQINAFKKEAGAIDELIRKRDLLERQSAKDKNPERAERAKKAIVDLNRQIDNQTQALTKNVQASGLVQKAYQQELGIIQKLSDRINDLKQARDRQTTVEGIREINREISKLNDELKDLSGNSEVLSSSGGGKGLLSQLLGVGSAGTAGKQVLQGVLAGAGIGVGFSVLPAIISNLTEYTSRLLDARRATVEVEQASRGLGDALNSELQNLVDLNKALNELFGSGAIAFNASVQQAAATGVVEGKVFEDRVRRFNAEQEAREAELSQLDEINTKYAELQKALVRYDKSRNLGALRERLKEIGLSEDELIRVNKKIDDIFSGLTRGEKERVKLSENDALVSIGATSIANANRIQAEIDNAKIAFEAETAKQIFELNKKLNEDIFNARKQLSIQQQSILESDTSVIEKTLMLQRDLQLENLKREVKNADLNGLLTTEVQKKFNERKRIINETFQTELTEQTRKFNLSQLLLNEKINQELLQSDLQNANARLKLVTGIDFEENLRLRNEITDKELELVVAKNSAQYSAEVQALQKLQQERKTRGEEQTQAYKETEQNILDITAEFTQKQNDAVTISTRDRLNNIEKGYADVVKVIRQQSAQLLQNVKTNFSAKQFEIAEGRGGLFGRDFQNRIADLQRQRQEAGVQATTAEAQLRSATQALNEAQAAFDNATSESDIKASELALNNAKKNVSQIEQVINEAQTKNINAARQISVEYVNAYAEAFKSIAEIAQKGYNEINQYRIQDLDREISAREQRVDTALKLAEYGNTQILDIEREGLRQAQRERRNAALQQQAINSALQLSYSLVAVAKAAAEGGGIGSIATVAAALGAIESGYGVVRSLSQQQQTTGFVDGGYTGDGDKFTTAGTVHRGEFVFPKSITQKHRPFFETIYRTGEIPLVPQNNSPTIKEFSQLKDAVFMVKDAIEGQNFKAINKMDGNGVTQLIERQQTRNRIKYRA